MKGKCKLPAALDSEDKLVLVDKALPGEVYNCPACKEIVIAKKGQKKVHHFAHKSGSNCQYGYQTSVHLMAKEIIEKTHRIIIPGRGKVDVDEVIVETKLGSIIPDILVICDGKKYIIEVLVTHQVDDEKKEKIKVLDISAIEVNLSDYKQMVDEKALENELYRPERSEFVYNADTLRIEKKRNYLLNYGEKITIRPNNEILCPLTKNQAILKGFCDSCIFSCEDIEKGYIRCGYCVGNDIMTESFFTLVTHKRVMGVRESVDYWNSFKKNLEKSVNDVLISRAMRRFRPRRSMFT